MLDAMETHGTLTKLKEKLDKNDILCMINRNFERLKT